MLPDARDQRRSRSPPTMTLVVRAPSRQATLWLLWDWLDVDPLGCHRVAAGVAARQQDPAGIPQLSHRNAGEGLAVLPEVQPVPDLDRAQIGPGTRVIP